MDAMLIDTDILIIGGGAAGCFAAVEIYKKSPNCRVVIMEKAHIERSGCLAMGLNAINAYLHSGQTPESYVSYVEQEFEGVIRKDLVYTGEHSCGVFGYGIKDSKFYVVRANAVIVATGGASGLYRPNNTGESRHLTWYCPWNAGTGYAMGIRAGAEMTSFESRFIALRVKDVHAPTGTIAVGVHSKQ